MLSFFLILLGLAIGSFLGALTYRWARGLSIAQGRSYCDICETKLSWKDNLPVISYIILLGKCRNCRGKISPRYPLIEIFTALSFLFVFVNMETIKQNLAWVESLPYPVLVLYLLIIASLLVTIFVTDYEHKIIFDEIVFIGIIVTLVAFLISDSPLLYANLLAGFLSSLFLLFITFITRGRGMGLGDAKLALFLGLNAGLINSATFLFFSFLVGAIVGIILLIFGRARLKQEIPFGPFMIAGYCLMLLWGHIFTYIR